MPLIIPQTWTCLAASAVAVPLTGSTSETTLATVTVPALAMGPNGILRVWTQWSVNNDASSKTSIVRFGGTGGTAYLNTNAASNLSVRSVFTINNRNSNSSQVGGAAFGFLNGISTASTVTSAIDTSAAADLVFRGQLADGTDTITLESYIVEVMRRP